jgi:phosphonate transport system substrate-binding protein
VQFFAVQSNAAQIEAMRAGRLHIAGFNTGSNPLAVNCAGFVPFAMMAARDGRFGYEMEIKAPSALLESQFGLVAGRDYRTAFSGRHDNSILGVANRDYEAAAIANSVLARMVARRAVDPSRIRSIYRSESFPTTAYGHAHNLHPELAANIRRAFFSFNWEGTALAREFNTAEPPQEQFIPITYQQHWQVVRQIDAAMNVRYTCR